MKKDIIRQEAVSILNAALKEVGYLYGIPDSFPYRKTAEQVLLTAFQPIALSVRKMK